MLRVLWGVYRPGGRTSLRRDVGRELPLEQGDLIFEVEFAFLEALELELILNCALC
jgi:hypothetical protein